MLPTSTGIYIHVPFCERRCIYCSFYSTVHGKREREAFVHRLCDELKLRCPALPVQTIYFGGGTPSQLDEKELEIIFEALYRECTIAPKAEITFEANPDDITTPRAQHLFHLGVTRVSLGIQSFDDAQLLFLRRRHTAAQARCAVNTLRNAGIKNISIDLIFGLPKQNATDWDRELQQALSLPIQHLSAYALTYEEHTPLYYARERGEVKECDDESSIAMFESLINATKTYGFEHYEISNFARTGFRSRHNSSYWAGVPYLGLGPGAHSYDGFRTRRINDYSLRRYLLSGEQDHTKDVPHTIEVLSDDDFYNEQIMTRLRTCEGIRLESLPHGRRADLLHWAQSHLEGGNLCLTPNGNLRLTQKGIFLSDSVISDLMWI